MHRRTRTQTYNSYLIGFIERFHRINFNTARGRVDVITVGLDVIMRGDSEVQGNKHSVQLLREEITFFDLRILHYFDGKPQLAPTPFKTNPRQLIACTKIISFIFIPIVYGIV